MSKLFIVEGNQTRVLDQKAFDNETPAARCGGALPGSDCPGGG
ncbi:MAG: hypothetical protein ACOX1J_06120 [Dethiobacteria bacterium]